jgi:hypothetical protein
MHHRLNPRLSKRFDLEGRPSSLKSLPVLKEFRLVNLGPCFHEAALALRQIAAEHLDGIKGENGRES